MTHPRRRPSHATIVAYLALFVALGGTAGALAGKNTVNSRDIKPKAVRTGDLAKNAVNRPKIRAGAVSEPKIGPGAVTGIKVLDGSLGQADLGAASVGGAQLATDAVSPDKLDVFRSDQRTGSVPVTGASGQALGPAVTLQIPAGGLVVFYAEANIQVNGTLGDSSCRLHAETGSSDVFLLDIDPGSGNPPQPFRSDLVPAIFPAGSTTFTLEGSVNGVTTNTCTFVNPALRAFVLG